MKPGFTEYNTVGADACQILAIAEIQYLDPNGLISDEIRAQQCRSLRIALGAVILESTQMFHSKTLDAAAIEEQSIIKLYSPFLGLVKKLPQISSDMKSIATSQRGIGALAAVLFRDDNHWGIYNITRLQTNLAILLHQEKDILPRPISQNGGRVVTNLFMQPYHAIECEDRANVKLAEFIAARINQMSQIESKNRHASDDRQDSGKLFPAQKA